MTDFHPAQLVRYITQNYALVGRYIVSGLSGIVANLVVFSVLVEQFSVWYIFAALWGFVAAYIVTFLMHKFWTFAATGKERTLFQSFLYLLSALGTLVINTALLYAQVEWVGIGPIVAQFIALGISAVLSFVFTSQVTFHQDEGRLRQLGKVVEGWARQPRTALWLVVIVALLFTFFRLVYVPTTYTSDAVGYVATAEYLMGDGGEFIGARFLKPIAPAVTGVLAQLSGGDYAFALLLQAVAGYVALAAASYWFGWELFQSRRRAVLTSLLLITTYPMLRYGLDCLIETGIWALYLGALAATLRWSATLHTKWLWLTAGFLLAGVLWKEYAVLAGVVLGLVILSHRELVWWQKGTTILQTAFLVLLPWVIWQWHVYEVYQFSYLDWLTAGNEYSATYTLSAVVKSFFALLTLAWPFVFLAWWRRTELTPAARRFLWCLLVPSFGFLLWGWVSSRLFFSAVPLLVPLAVLGLSVFPRFRTQLLVVVCIGICNLGLVWFAFQPDVRAFINEFTYGDESGRQELGAD